jgi:hypothetical protein
VPNATTVSPMASDETARAIVNGTPPESCAHR